MLNSILLKALETSDYGKVALSDVNLAKSLSLSKEELFKRISKLSDCFELTKLSYSACPNCLSKSLDTRSLICGHCGEICEKKNLQEFRIILKRDSTKNRIKKFLSEILLKDKWTVREDHSDFIAFEKEDLSLNVILSLDTVYIKDFYSLRGWLSTNKRKFFLILAPYLEGDLLFLISKENLIQNLTIKEFFGIKSEAELKSKIKDGILSITEEKDVENLFGKAIVRENLDLQELKVEMNDLFENLEVYALNKKNLPVATNGYKYQDSVNKLCRISPLQIKILGGADKQDLLIRIPPYNPKIDKAMWIPFEAKSFKPKPQEEPKWGIKDYASQIKKYIQGHKNKIASSSYSLLSFSIIAYDFLLDKENIEILEQIEKDEDVHICLFPQKSFVHLIKENISKGCPIIDWDPFIDLFTKKRYIEIEDIDNLFKKLNENFDKSPEATAIKIITKEVHKKGK